MKTSTLAIALCLAMVGCSKPAPETTGPAAAMPAAETTPVPEAPLDASPTQMAPEATPATNEPAPQSPAPMAEGSSPPVQGRIALLNATCPGEVSVHADEGGPVYINGSEAKLDISNENYYEARDTASGVTVSVSTNPDGSSSVSYTGKDRANGVCTVN